MRSLRPMSSAAGPGRSLPLIGRRPQQFRPEGVRRPRASCFFGPGVGQWNDRRDRSPSHDARGCRTDLAARLRQHWLASPHKAADDFVFAAADGRGLDYRDVGLAFRTALKRAGITASGHLSLHSLRHGYASLLIAHGLDVMFVSRQLGHANPSITLTTYAHLWNRADHAASHRSTRRKPRRNHGHEPPQTHRACGNSLLTARDLSWSTCGLLTSS
jgi:hypothetical protein